MKQKYINIYHWFIRSNYKNKYASSQHATEMTGVKSRSKPMAEGALNKTIVLNNYKN